jgi:hypothetical protein
MAYRGQVKIEQIALRFVVPGKGLILSGRDEATAQWLWS